MTSYEGNRDVWFVEIRMVAAGQTSVANTYFGIFGGQGQYFAANRLVTNVANDGINGRILIAGAEFDFRTGIAPDLTVVGSLPNPGMVCWGAPGNGPSPPSPGTWDLSNPDNYVDCVAYGGYSGPSNRHIGAPISLSAEGRSLQRIAISNNNAEDFLCNDTATPRSNAGSTVSLPPSTPCSGAVTTTSTSVPISTSTTTTETLCGNATVDPGEECDDGNLGSQTDCCTASCAARQVGRPCGDPSESDCDSPNSCDDRGRCDDNREPEGTPCRVAGTLGVCDPGATCDGVVADCPVGDPEAGCDADVPDESAGSTVEFPCFAPATVVGGVSTCNAKGFEALSTTGTAVTGAPTGFRRGRGVTERILPPKRKLRVDPSGRRTRLVRLRLNALGKRLLRKQQPLFVLVEVNIHHGGQTKKLESLLAVLRNQ